MIDVSLLMHSLLGLLLIIAIVSDVTRFIIPNWLVMLVLCLYPIMLLLTPMPVAWAPNLLMAVGVLLIGMALFAAKLMGGGDVKLLAACSLWLGMQQLLPFLIIMALIGGVMAMVLLIARPIFKRYWTMLPIGGVLPRIFTPKEPIPYGVAIAAAMMWYMYHFSLPGLFKPIYFMVQYG